jgi:integrase
MAVARVRSFFGWLADRDIISISPAAGVRMPAELVSRDRVLDDDELRLVWKASGTLSEPFGAFVRMLMLTGQRRDEVARMTDDELAGDLWTIPGDRAKNGEPHLVPLSPEALGVLAEVTRIGPANFVFSTTGRTAISGYSKAKTALDAAVAKLAKDEGRDPLAGWTLHDLRWSCATGLARLGVPVHVTELVLNHRSGSRAGIVGVYQRHQYLDERRAALEAWGRHLLGLTAEKPSNVVPFATPVSA